MREEEVSRGDRSGAVYAVCFSLRTLFLCVRCVKKSIYKENASHGIHRGVIYAMYFFSGFALFVFSA